MVLNFVGAIGKGLNFEMLQYKIDVFHENALYGGMMRLVFLLGV